MKKIRFNLSIEDYYDYVGTNPHKSLKNRALESLPQELREGYNMKFKRIVRPYSFHKWYRIHITAKITDKQLEKMLKDNGVFAHQFDNFSYKVIQSNI